MPDYKLISADSHVSEPPDLWSTRVDAKYRDRAPRLMVNPPGKPKYQYWTGSKPNGADLDAWLSKAIEHAGSWWPDWLAWLKHENGETVPARAIGGGKLKAIEDAPGSYVKVRDSD